MTIVKADLHFSLIQRFCNVIVQNSEKCHMTLTFDLSLTLTLSLTFDLNDLKKIFCFKIFDFFEVTWRENVTSFVKSEGCLQKRHSVRNVVQPTRSLYDFRFRSYDTLCEFYKSGDLDLDLYPIITKNNCQRPWNWIYQL